MSRFRRAAAYLCLFVFAWDSSQAEHLATPGTTLVSRWKDGYSAAFVLMFDDGCGTHPDLAIPLMRERKLTGTFFLNPGTGNFKSIKGKWETTLKEGDVVYGNHTWTHSGFNTLEEADAEFAQATQYLLDTFPGKTPRLISFAVPGVGPGRWNLTPEQFQALLKKYNLADRGEFRNHGSMVHQQTSDEMVALLDKALSVGGMEYIVFHAIADPGKGTIATPRVIFEDFLNKLESRRDRVWITDHLSAHKYEKEREGASVQIVEATNSQIRINLSSTVDPQLYDYPLTLLTAVPPGWKACRVTQAGKTAAAAVVNNTVQYEAIPGAGEIVIQPAS